MALKNSVIPPAVPGGKKLPMIGKPRSSLSHVTFNWLFFSGIVVGLYGCSPTSNSVVKIVVPKDYLGKVTLEMDHKAAPPKDRDGVLVYTVPQNGWLKTCDFSVFDGWHKTIVEYSDGRMIYDDRRDVVVHHPK